MARPGPATSAAAAGAFIEDAAEQAISPTFHMLLGATADRGPGAGRLMSSDLPKASWMVDVALDFRGPSASLRDSSLASSPPVRIYVHRVPPCAGESVLKVFIDVDGSSESGFGWPRALKLHAEHAWAVHRAIVESEFVVDDPREATVFYIPAFLGFLVERYIDTQDQEHLNCISATWLELPDVFLRNAGYDHFLVAGTCHPYSICSSMECDITTWHPFAGNVALLAGGFREVGHPDVAFSPAEVFRQLRTMSVPFPVLLDCALLRRLSEPSAHRPTVVAFIGSENSRVRRLFRELVEDDQQPFGNDERVSVHVLPDTGEGEAARRAALGGLGSWRNAQELYSQSEFCLVLPGHVYDLGRRAYDAMAHGCLPVVVAVAPMHVSVPFAWQLPWEEFAIFASVATVEDAASIVRSLLAATEDPGGRAAIASRRAALLRHAPALFLPPHLNCPAGAPSALHGIVRELAARQAALAAVRAVRPPGFPRPGVVAV